ncbi:MAG: hypothetical protein R3C03_23635 [Pirellulaceae bacterium]
MDSVARRRLLQMRLRAKFVERIVFVVIIVEFFVVLFLIVFVVVVVLLVFILVQQLVEQCRTVEQLGIQQLAFRFIELAIGMQCWSFEQYRQQQWLVQ